MLEFTVEIAKSFNVTPFEIFRQDKDEVILLINYFSEKSETEKPTKSNSFYKKENNTNQRIMVNDKTATGGWW